MKTPITYYGGKQQMAGKIISFLPSHKIYCEPFFGGGAVFFAKPKSYLEVINDKNDRLINFYKVVQNQFSELETLISQSLHSESEYYRAKDIYNGRIEANNIELAWSIWTITNFSYSGSMHGGWKYCNGTAGSHTGIFSLNKRNSFDLALKNRLSETQIPCRDALKVIKDRDTINTIFYLDPPYPGSYQGHYSGYTMREFAELLELISNIKGKFILSNYWSQTLKHFVIKNNWGVDITKLPLKVAKNNGYKTEILIMNYKFENTLFD